MNRIEYRIKLFSCVIILLFLIPAEIFSGGYLVVSRTGVPFKWDNSQPIPLDMDGGGFGTLDSTAAVALAEGAINIWAAEPTLMLTFNTASIGQLVADGDVSTAAEYAMVEGVNDGLSPVIFDEDGSLIDALGFEPGVIGFAIAEFVNVGGLLITESLQLYNGNFIDGDASDGFEFSLDEMEATITHEMGHAINFDHTQVNGHFFIGDTDDPGFAKYGSPPSGVGVINIMFPFSLSAANNSTVPRRDDLATAEFIYGNGTGATGVISGVVVDPGGIDFLQGANVIVRNELDPFFDAVSSVSGYLFFPTGPGSGTPAAILEGTFDTRGLDPAANYTVEKVRVNAQFTQGSSVGPVDPPITLEVEEFYNGLDESNIDDPMAFELVSGNTINIGIICNLPLGGKISVSPAEINFGAVAVGGTHGPIAITINNGGADTLTVSSISDPGSPFVLGNMPTLPVGIPPAGSETFDVSYTPSAVGVNNATITLTSDDIEQPAINLPLQGEGINFTPASTGVCYGSTGRNGSTPGSLISIDPVSGAGTLIGPTGLAGVPGLAINSNGEIFGTELESGDIYRIDAATGETAFVLETGVDFLDAIAFNESNDFFGVGGDLALYKIDLQTRTVAKVGDIGDVITGLAFDPTTSILWGSVGGFLPTIEDGIYTIDTTTGAGIAVGQTGLGGATPDIHFDAAGNLFGVKGGGMSTNNLISIDKSTGAATVIGAIGFTAVSGLALFTGEVNFAPAITPIDDQMVDEGGRFELQVDAADPEGDAITFSLTQNPGWLSVDSNTGVMSGDPANTDIGLHDVTVKATDDKGAFSTASFTIEVKEVNAPPANFALLNPANGAEIDDLNPTLTWEESVDPNGDEVSYAVLISTLSDFSDTLSTDEVADPSFKVPAGLQVSTDYYWKVTASDDGGLMTASNEPFMFHTSDIATSIAEDYVPVNFSLFQNYPNPFNPETQIRYDVPALTRVKITVLNMLGQTIRTLVDADKPSGAYSVVWDGRRDNGEPAVSGVYIYQFVTAEFRQTKKMLLLK